MLTISEIRNQLFNMQDKAYRDFHSRLVPTLDKETIIGVRTPLLRNYAMTLAKNGETDEFLKNLPHSYYEENNLHAFIIEAYNDFDTCIAALDKLLPYIDNWATCDGLRPKCFKKNLDRLKFKALEWINDGRTYVKRFGIGVLMNHYLNDEFDEEYLRIVSEIRSKEYYVNMMIAWYFATALSKQYDKALPYFKEKRLEKWTHNKTIQKSVESFRISAEQKNYLKTLRM